MPDPVGSEAHKHGPTPSQTVGPFFSIGAAWMAFADLVDRTAPGAMSISGGVYDGSGGPVADAMVEIWQAGAGGQLPSEHGFGRALTDAGGRFEFATVKPGRVDATQAPHIDVSVFARGLLQRLVTRIYFPDEGAANEADPVLASIADPAARSTLVAVPDGDGLRFDVRLQGEGETVFFDW